jgi:uncharacterized protein YndB with AHSA1/START domain
MKGRYFASATAIIPASPQEVWHALTDPETIKQFMFGSTVNTDWQVGSAITFAGEWEGKTYEDKGEIKDVIENERLVTTYFSPLSGKEDKPENYHTVSYMLESKDGGTEVMVCQDNIETKKEAEQSSANWKTMLDSLKKLLEAR